MLQVLRQGQLLLFDQGEVLLTKGQPHTQQVYIVLRGHVSMLLGDGRSFLAGLPLSKDMIACACLLLQQTNWAFLASIDSLILRHIVCGDVCWCRDSFQDTAVQKEMLKVNVLLLLPDF